MVSFPRSSTTFASFSTARRTASAAPSRTVSLIDSGVTFAWRPGSIHTAVTWTENASPEAGRNRTAADAGS